MAETAIIPLKKQSNYDELRYCLRALCLQYPDIRLVIVGPERPEWINRDCEIFRQVWYEDAISYEWKSKNIFDKTLAGFRWSGQDKLLFLNDDHYILAPVDYSHHKGLLKDHIAKRNPLGCYTHTLQNTLQTLGEVGIGKIYDFDTHCPIWYEYHRFKNFAHSVDWTKPHGYGIKTLYCSWHNIIGEYYEDIKFHESVKADEVKDRLYFSTEDGCRLNELEKLFPHKCKFELP